VATLQIPIAKAGRNVTIEVDTDFLNDAPDEVINLVILEGLKTVLNSRMSKVKSPKAAAESGSTEEEAKAALAQAEKNLEDLKAGKLKKRTSGASSKTGVAREVMTEARRLAKEDVKNQMRAKGIKISHVKASQITAAANAFIEADPSYITRAEANLSEAKAKTIAIDITALIQEDAKLVEKAEAAKSERKSQLSAKQAGKVAKRKPGAELRAH